MAQKNEVIIHCSDTRPDWMSGRPTAEKVAEIRRWHVKERGWKDIGYAEIIDRDGTRYPGRDTDNDGDTWEEIGAHAVGHNTNSIGVCLLGGHGSKATDKFSDNFTPEQERSLLRLLGEVKARYGSVKISGHNDYAQKACPGFKVSGWLANSERSQRASISESKTIQASQVAKVAAVASPIVGMFSNVPWQTLAVMGAFTLIILLATGIIDLERLKKWRRGDR
mgnify:CR=1 FL=1